MGDRGLWTLDCRPNDLVINCFNYRLYSGGIMDHMSFENLGATILPCGVGSSAAFLELLAHLPEPCACGRHSFRFNVLGRSDDMFIVKSVNVFPLSAQEALLSLRPQVTGEFFIELEQTPPSDVPPKIMVEVSKC